MSKAKAKTYKSEAMAAVHEMLEGLHDAGSIDKRTMREFEHVLQPVFARYLNVSKNLVSDWDRGEKKPGGPALRLLSIIQRSGLDAIA